jgi:hypothetical protein
VPEPVEYERLGRRKRRSPEAQKRMEELCERTSDLNGQGLAEPRTPENDLVLYGAEVGSRIPVSLRARANLRTLSYEPLHYQTADCSVRP